MSTHLRILLIEDSEDDATLLLREIQHAGYKVKFERVETAQAMRTALAQQTWDIILCDYSLPKFSAPQALELAKESGYDLPFIIVSGTIGEESAVSALKAGAHDFLIKGNFARLVPAIQRELKEAEGRRERRQRERELEAIASVSSILQATTTLHEMLPRLLDEALALIKAEGGNIWLHDPATGEINQVAQRGQIEAAPLILKRGQGITALVMEQREIIVTREFRTDPRVAKENRERIPEGIGGACVPFRAGEVVVGGMYIYIRLPREIAAGELRVLNTLAEIGGNAIHRRSLHEQTVKQLERLEGLRTIDLAISSSLDLRVSLNILLEQVTKLLGVDAASVLLINRGSGRLEYMAGRGFRTHNIETSNVRLGQGHAGKAAFDKKTVYVADLSMDDEAFMRRELLASEEFISYFGLPLIAKGEVKGVLEVFNRSQLNPDHEWLAFLETLAGQTAIAIENSILFQNLQRSNVELIMAYDATIEGWSHALDLRDRETEGHTQRVTEMTLKFAGKMGMGEEQLVHIRRGALLHDIGKMGVPDNILLKPEPLTKEERNIIKQHPQLAYNMLQPITYLRDALDIPYCHHEKWNGTGYPRGLSGAQIPLEARLFTIVDVWDALTSNRPYRNGWSKKRAIKYIREQSGEYFDPQLVEVFLKEIID